ncbi:MAG: YdhK family protein [Bacillota bacterium]
MANNKVMIATFSAFAAMTISACNADPNPSDAPVDMDEQMEENMGEDSEDMFDEMEENMDEYMDDADGHMGMNRSGSREVPDDLREAQNPQYEVGTQAILDSDHMIGMRGAEATIVGAYETTVYEVSYTPLSGGPAVSNHRWVIHEELENAGDEPFEPGDEVVIDADHMRGMSGVTATIDSAEETIVYMVDFHTTDGGDRISNHKWVTEDELTPVN